MSSPLSGQSKPGQKKNWLERLLKVQLTADRAVSDALEEAAKDAERELLRIASVPGIGAGVRRSQLLAARRAIGEILNDLFLKVRVSIEEGQSEAVAQAFQAAVKDETKYLQMLFPSKAAREAYMVSAEQSARRNVQAMLTRVTGDKRSLSRRVYHTKALANGYVDRTINNHLARGSSASTLAKAVADSIRPNVPGGVAYRAKTLARTEINNAYHAQSKVQNQDKPWVLGVDWNLSKSHPRSPGDLCEVYAKQQVFLPDQVPDKPHPNCFCYTTPRLEDLETFHKKVIVGVYNGWAQDNAAA